MAFRVVGHEFQDRNVLVGVALHDFDEVSSAATTYSSSIAPSRRMWSVRYANIWRSQTLAPTGGDDEGSSIASTYAGVVSCHRVIGHSPRTPPMAFSVPG